MLIRKENIFGYKNYGKYNLDLKVKLQQILKMKYCFLIIKPKYFLLIFSIVFFQACSSSTKVDLIIYNATIYKTDSLFSIAQSMAIKEDKIVAVGTNDEIQTKFKSKEIINAEGKYIFPGFIDAHCHFTGFATDMWKCDLTGLKSMDEVIEIIEKYSAKTKTEWIYGRGWDQNDWQIKEFPDKRKLDSLFPNRPVFLKRIDGHAALVNQAGLNLAKININTIIPGGSVERKDGKLTGLLLDNAMDVVDKIIPQLNDSLSLEYFEEAQRLCLAVGLTGVHDCGITEKTLSLLKDFENSGKLKIKVFALLSDSSNYYDDWIKKGIYLSDHIKMGGFKIYSDGALGSRGACLLEDYSDKPHWRGFLLSDKKHFKEIAHKLINSPFQMCTHAIGDSANREILKIYSEVLKNRNDRRWRIEHAQVISKNDFHYFKDFAIIPSVQPTHATSDMYWAESRLGPDRIKFAYAYQTLLKTNGWLPLGTDFPVEDISPFKTFYAAVVRKDSSGFPPEGFEIQEKLTREQALRGMTIWAAKAAFQENEKGSLEIGKAADFIIIDKNIMTCNENEILKTKVFATYINGKKVY